MIKILCYNNNFMQENTYVIIDESTGHGAVVDPGCYPLEMKQELQELNVVDSIILTHGHGDHIASLPSVRKDFPNAILIAGADEKDLLTNASLNHSDQFGMLPVEMEADRYVADGDVISVGDAEFKVLTTPGHTPGGICIYGLDVLFSGDTLFKRSVGRTDFEGGSWEELADSLKKLMLLPDDTVILCGHGPTTTIGQERRENPFV